MPGSDRRFAWRRDWKAAIGTAGFLTAPVFVAGWAPWRISRWRFAAPFFGMGALRFAGGLLIAAGAAVVLDSFVRFAREGFGTPAPIYPTSRLVVGGLYRYVRNPMYVAVVSAIVGQGLLFGKYGCWNTAELSGWDSTPSFCFMKNRRCGRGMGRNMRLSAQRSRGGFLGGDPYRMEST